MDYRAVAQRAVIAAPDAQHMWVATDTGAILSRLDRRLNKSSAAVVLSTLCPQWKSCKTIDSKQHKSLGKGSVIDI